MSVRAKFKVDEIRRSHTSRMIDPAKGYYPDNLERVEMRTVVMSPVYTNNDPEHENTKFWNASPSGKLELGTINPEAWRHFELGKEYYVDFHPAE